MLTKFCNVAIYLLKFRLFMLLKRSIRFVIACRFQSRFTKMSSEVAANGNGLKEEKGKCPTVQETIPEFIGHREQIWQQLKAQEAAEIERKEKSPIKVTFVNKDGEKVVDGVAWQTSPIEICRNLDRKLSKETIIAKVNGQLWDLERPLESDSTVSFLKFGESDEANAVFWHSTAHVLGEAMERYYGGLLCYGPPIAEGFYYDMFNCANSGKNVSADDFPALEKIMQKIVNERQPFERLEMTREQLLEMFNYNEFKCRIIRNKIDTPTTTAYKCGTLIDLCRGPHVPTTAILQAFKVTKNSSSYWEGDNTKESLQRVYGVSFPEKKEMKEWVRIQEEAAKRDHRRIGREQELFFFHELSPGSCFFMPKGAIIYNRLVDWMREQYRIRGYDEVISPNMYNTKLWQISGHLEHYSSNMFQFDVENQKFALKPMNCPGHALMFGSRPRSFKELPLRMADFGILHRNERMFQPCFRLVNVVYI